MWNTELEMVAQRWTDQCQPGHDTERGKADGSLVGQNFWESWSSGEEDEANVQAGIGEATESWYNEVLHPEGQQGHYTQLVSQHNQSGRI